MTVSDSSHRLLYMDRPMRRAALVSVSLHAILVIWLVLYRHLSPSPLAITEIAWLDAPEAAAEAPKPQHSIDVVKRESEDATPAPTGTTEHFERRKRPEAELQPTPQSAQAIQDRLARRLETLQRGATSTQPLAVAVRSSRTVLASGPTPSVATPTPIQLDREDTSTPLPPEPLVRSVPDGAKRRLAPVPIAEPEVEEVVTRMATPTSTKSVAGASLMGPVADREVKSYKVPRYPDWAQHEGLEASVSLYFVVQPSGAIREGIVVQTTSGFHDFDANAIEALRQWRFEALPRGVTGDQWGAVTFRYRLNAG